MGQVKRWTSLVCLAVLANAWATLGQSQESLKSGADTVTGRSLDAPINTLPVSEKFWWSDEWYDDGVLEVPQNHAVVKKGVSYLNPVDGTEIPAIVFRPKTEGRSRHFPCLLSRNRHI